MSNALQSLGIDRMSVADRIELVHEIWDSIATETASAPLTQVQRDELDRRLAAHRANPAAAIPWEHVEADASARMRR